MKMNKFIMMCGISGSGKSTYAKEIAIKERAIVISSDALRKELYGDENVQDNNSELFIEIHRRIKEKLNQGLNVILDSTNINYKKRIELLNSLNKLSCEKECYLIATPYDICLEQNNKRERKVPQYVITRMYKSFYIPQYSESWDKIHIIKNFKAEDYVIADLFKKLDTISQDNPFHSLTIGKHCRKCNELLKYNTSIDTTLLDASLLHDIGKEFCKTFKNSKGEITDVAHFYNHEGVSAYMSLFYLQDVTDIYQLEVAKLIQFHMRPFSIETEKAKRRFVRLVGEDFYEDLLVLHEADTHAK